ncbi:hypothetical protein Aple_004580 [Acrocarpospora pleiomorpha]|uniref:SnoaL-like domain-containing protein n=1 Tax=Acrocarpospora pleiomorpha TaxID=90975 RepID=A0A5M3XF36_9ACTN|nr:nitroreductase/quinone reductase family protein [Acrocarpospora pleiomorpha]GES17563.1 hypothetical protein Aple_004580 [Acrocarpospora pleiomorpha]
MGDNSQGLEQRVAELERAVTRLNDIVEIQHLLASYGPSVDSNSIDLAGEIWVEDGIYEIDGWELGNRQQIRDMLYSETHQEYVRVGSSHQVSPPRITLQGDTAVAITYQILIANGPHGFMIRRLTANRWALERRPEGWRVRRRTNRLLNGSPAARLLFRHSLQGVDDPLAVFEEEYEPTPRDFAREQVELFERSNGTEGNTMQDRPIVVLTTIGRKSGKVRKSPLIRVEHDGQYVAIASYGGRPENPEWYGNLLHQPQVELQDGATKRRYLTRVLTGAERDTWWDRAVEAFPTYAEYQLKTARRIPVVLLQPL